MTKLRNMRNVRLTIPFYSTYGTNHKMATIAAEVAEETGAEVRLRRCEETAPDEVVNGQEKWKEQRDRMADIPVVKPDDLEWSNAYLFSAPTRFGSVPSQMQAFIDTLGPLWEKGALANKAASAMTSTGTQHGGQETTLTGLYVAFMHWGAVIVPPGYTDEVVFELGNPYGTSAIADEVDETVQKMIRHQTSRVVEIAGKLAA